VQYTLITTNEALQMFCNQAAKVQAIAVDTEFVRTRTLYPQLGLIQIYDGQQIVLIDPLAISDFTPLKTLLTDPQVVKIMHSCSEDLETFWYALQVIPQPLFDSQFAAALVGMGPSLGYAKLVDVMLGVHVDKGESRTDWLARPLSPQQCQYAAYDVLYLLQLYPELHAKTVNQHKLAWVYTEIAHLACKKQSQIPHELLYLNIKHNWHLTGKSLYVLQQLAAWRTREAQSRDLALNFVVREAHLLEVARCLPTTKAALQQVPGLTSQEVRINGQAMLDIVLGVDALPEEAYPPNVERLVDFPGYKKTVTAVREVCMNVAQEMAIPVELIGSKKQVEQLLKWCWFSLDETRAQQLQPDLLGGWREPLLRQKLAQIDSLKLPSDEK